MSGRRVVSRLALLGAVALCVLTASPRGLQSGSGQRSASDSQPLAAALADLSAEHALELSRADGRPLLLAFLCAGDPQSERIDATCWSEPRVVDWSRDVGRIVRVETAEQLDLADEFGVDQVPSLIWLQDGEVVRRLGAASPRGLGEVSPGWLAHSLWHPPGVPTTDADLVCLFFDEWALPSTRLMHRYNLWERLPAEQRLADLRWVWDHWLWTLGSQEDDRWPAVVRMVLGDPLEGLVAGQPEARALRARFADELEAAVDAAPSDARAWRRWLIVGREFAGEPRVATHVEGCLARWGADGVPESVRLPLRKFYPRVAADSLGVGVGLLVGDVEAACREQLTRTAEDLGNSWREETWLQPVRGMDASAVGKSLDEWIDAQVAEAASDAGRRAIVVESLVPALAAGRHDEVRRAAALLLAAQDTAVARLDLVAAVLDADARWQAAARRDDAFGRFVAELPRPRESLAVESRAWLAEAADHAVGDEAERAAALARRLPDH